MRFSIVVPVYKTEDYLAQCVDSILAQSFTDFELILVDNESPDSCPEICENYAKQDERVRVIHKKHGKAASARNVGMKEAKGEYLCFLDSDDFWANAEVLSKINEKLSSGDIDILELYYQFYFQKTGQYMCPNQTDFSGFEKLSNEEKLDFLVKHDRLNPSAWGICISRPFLENNRGYFNETLITEDIEWCIRLFSANPKIDALTDPVYIYRQNRAGSVTSKIKFQNVWDLCNIIENAPNILSDKENPIHAAMMNYVSYQVLIAVALPFRKSTDITKKQKAEIHRRLKVFCKKYLKKYQRHPKVKKAVKVYQILGYAGMARAVGFYLNYLRR